MNQRMCPLAHQHIRHRSYMICLMKSTHLKPYTHTEKPLHTHFLLHLDALSALLKLYLYGYQHEDFHAYGCL